MTRTSLPKEHDFDPWNGCLDAQCAWKNFGGLSLEEAHARFRENPIYYQEDFMFMGGVAFAYYFPVIESYLLETPPAAEHPGDDREAWILAHCINQQFSGQDFAPVLPLKSRVLELANFVRREIARFSDDANEQRRIINAWQELEAQLRSVRG